MREQGQLASVSAGLAVNYSFVSVTLNVSKPRPARREAFERDPGA